MSLRQYVNWTRLAEIEAHVNLDIHGRNTRQSSSLHLTTSNLSLYQRGTHYMGIKIFHSLSSYIKDLSHNIKQSKLGLKNFLYSNCFYTLDEYFNCNNASDCG